MSQRAFKYDLQYFASVNTYHLITHSDHVFFYSYVQPPPKEKGARLWSNAEELARVNTLLLKNFLGAIDIASIKPQRIMLQTGAKNYG